MDHLLSREINLEPALAGKVDHEPRKGSWQVKIPPTRKATAGKAESTSSAENM